MEKIEFMKLAGPDFLVQFGYMVEDAFKNAVRDALRTHKNAGNAVAVIEDGRVILLEPDQIPLD